MKEYIFLLEEPVGTREIKIFASGMMDAFKKAKEFRKNIVQGTKLKVNMILKGVRYTD
ncbi:hypothetical protein SAMN05444673_3475 [Bacillus sp. OV166]|uniref:hypothetical protein n=1 Tax=unclassified Bacillus (in: firmicutes) TaxID=185979 RepID=UPI000A2AC5A2|nr:MULTISPECIES: hypothetical protein [unclassified Bacillus (in: firmicutes)]SMQ78512.1 hypothetical protein SAMN05444673_3475 [Bacillus sp. OV166]